MRTINLTEAEIEIIKRALQFVHDRKYDIIEQNRLILEEDAFDAILKNAAKYYDTRDVFDGSRDVIKPPEIDDVEVFLSKYKGEYKFKSPYHKNTKYLPFHIMGKSGYEEFPILCSTVNYRGWAKENITSGYTMETLLDKINSGYFSPVKPI